MQVFRDIESIQNFIHQQKHAKQTIGLVPTMGALHQGHLSLVEKSLQQTDITIASIFVNPIQFNNPSDLEKYPRTVDDDIGLLENAGCQALFWPSLTAMYAVPPKLKLDFGNLDKILEGKFRPGHFSGVGVVVAKLFNIIQPNVAYFGQKDYQQFLVINKLVDDLNFPIELVCGEIIREADGLAMSSRNKRLSPDDRQKAAEIFRSLSIAKNNLRKRTLVEIKLEIETALNKVGIKLEYVELADRATLNILDQYDPAEPSILLIAAFVGEVRLIDNMFV